MGETVTWKMEEGNWKMGRSKDSRWLERKYTEGIRRRENGNGNTNCLAVG
jgi:hypothetical protein